jgi:DNA-binding MarR family transcriptional regulator
MSGAKKPSGPETARDAGAVEEAEELRAAVGEFVRHLRGWETMPAGQAAALGYLAREGAQSIAGLARRERVKHQSMTRTVGLLESQGLVTLAPADHDRRQIVVALTAAGAERLDEQRRVRAGHIAAALATLGEEERELAARIPAILRKLTTGTPERP